MGKVQLLYTLRNHEIETRAKYGIPTIAKNLFINLTENIVKAFFYGSIGLGQIQSQDTN